MLIKDMFAKEIDRDIKGVIKVGQADDENIKQELEEYVVTRELQKHFAIFFANYKKGISGTTDKMGVWISGFFGSGKSHFLKILSYLLDNKEVNDKRAIDYFVEDNKIIDAMVLADMKLASAVSTDVILFNIDSKSDMGGKQSKEAIILVFLKVFNEMQGFCGSMPFLADLERQLTEQGRYEEFKEMFAADYGNEWEDSRHKFDFIQDSIVDVLNEMGFMSEAAARNWCERACEPYSISIEDFAKRVKSYIDRKGNNHHVVFLVDEIGQYIGDNSNLMLNLQTVTEDLGTACRGKVWIIVTSQQDIDSVTKTKGIDFSKIQGRFDTRLSLSSANVDEVIQKRILAKKAVVEETLKLFYEQKETIIKNRIVFNDGVEKKLYDDDKNFAAVYPFVPYQFNLLGSVLTSIRTHGASGKHLSEGERSMLALFKEAAMNRMEQELGAIVSFDVFYDALHQFLDHSHSGVIIHAQDNEQINPDHEKDCFNVSVLKTLFMVKYVKEVKANIDNITSLMISSVDEDRVVLRKQVEDALKILERQTLVQKNGEIYVFLTDEEQEINRQIEIQEVEMSEVIHKVSELIFEDIFSDKKYRYPAFNGRYNFPINQIVDDCLYRANQNYDIGVRILTPVSDWGDDEQQLRMLSGQNKEVLVVLPNDAAFLQELRIAMKIEKYLRLNTAENALAKFEQIKEAKRAEMRERNNHAKLFLTQSLENAAIYVNGDKTQIGAKEVSARINDALGSLVKTVYHKLAYIEAAMNESDIRALLVDSKQGSLLLENGTEANGNALADVQSYIVGNSALHAKTSMKSILERFMKAPYGFVEDDVEWLVAKLFKNGDISFMVNGVSVNMLSKSPEEITRYITKKEYVEKLRLERREKASDAQKKAVRQVTQELFGFPGGNNEDDAIMRSFQEHSRSMINELNILHAKYENEHRLPGAAVVQTGKKLLQGVLQLQSPAEFFKKIQGDLDDYFEFAEDYEPVKAFFGGAQKEKFDEALRLMKIYEESKSFIADVDVETCVADIQAILQNPTPYTLIPQLPELLEKFKSAYMAVLDKLEEPVNDAVEVARKRVLEELEERSYKAKLVDRFVKAFDDLQDKARRCDNVATMHNIPLEADALKIKLLNEITAKDDEIRKNQIAEMKKNYTTGSPQPDLPQSQSASKPKKNISIRSINPASSWQIENAADVDKYLVVLKQRILKELEEDTIINIEF